MEDQVQLRGIKVQAHCGATDLERNVLQPFEIDIDLEADQTKAGISDDLTDAINYAPVCELIVKIVDENKFSLMEKFAQVLVDSIFGLDESVAGVVVKIKKLEPPVDVEINSAGVSIRRIRQM